MTTNSASVHNKGDKRYNNAMILLTPALAPSLDTYKADRLYEELHPTF
ncbi:hypothetical protein [Armatimonas sp.]